MSASGCDLNRSMQHFILNRKDGVYADEAKKSSRFHFGGLPDGRVRIVSADDGEEAFSLAGLPGLLLRADGGKARIVI